MGNAFTYNLEIKKHKKNKGCYVHKSPGIKSSHTKKIAMQDISDYVKEEDSIYTKNYVQMESKVLNACNCIMKIVPIDTVKLLNL